MPKIERIKLSDNQDLVTSPVDNEKLDLRIFVKSDSYTGAKNRRLRMRVMEMSDMKQRRNMRTVKLSEDLREDLKDFARQHDFAELYRKYNWTKGTAKDTWENGFPCILELEKNMTVKAKRNLVKEKDVRQVAKWGGQNKNVKWCETVDLSLYDKSGDFRNKIRECPSIAVQILNKQKEKGLIRGLAVTYLSKVLRFAAPSEFGAIDTRIVRVFGQGDSNSKRHDWLYLKVYKGGRGWYISQIAWPRHYSRWIRILRCLAYSLNESNETCPHPQAFLTNGLRKQGIWECADVEMALWAYASQYTNLGKPYCP